MATAFSSHNGPPKPHSSALPWPFAAVFIILAGELCASLMQVLVTLDRELTCVPACE